MDTTEMRSTTQRQKLLIVEDSADIHDLVQVWLEGEPLEFFSCFNGEQALSMAVDVRPDLILLDVDLPGLDGFEVCTQLKADPRVREIPVVFLTGAASTQEKLRGLALGAADYVVKPFDPAEMRARVCSSLRTKRLMDLLEQKAYRLQESEERFRVLAENSSDVISRHAPDGAYLFASPAAMAILDYPPDSLVGRTLGDFVHPDDLAAVNACYWRPRSDGETGTVEFRFRRGNGQYIWLESTCRTLIDPLTRAVYEIHASARDITRRKQMEEREELRAAVLEMVAQGRPLNNILRRLIEGAERQEPQAAAAAVMLNAGIVHHCAPSLPPSLARSIELQLYSLLQRFYDLSSGGKDRVIVCDLMNDPAWEGLRPMLVEHGLKTCWAILVRFRSREATGAFAFYHRDHARPGPSAVEFLRLAGDLTGVAVEQSQFTDQLTFQAHHDAMTRLPNRTLFTESLRQALTRAARTGRTVGVLLIDVDRFKYINDTYGHQAGDEVLCQVARRLQNRLRASDVLARMGGDEFAVILSDLTQPADAHDVARAIVGEFGNPIDLHGRKQFITVSIGSATLGRDAPDASSLLKNADLALYRAKDDGRNTARSFSAEMETGSVERMEMESALREAVARNQLLLQYQPKVNTDGRIVGLEALLRWKHPVFGVVPPGKFIPLAGDTGMIIPIGAWVMQEAARQARAWKAAGLPVLPISVNVSALQFAQPDFVHTVSRTLALCALAENWLELELTESLIMRNICDAEDKLAQLRELGVATAVDDFGVGYSSLAYLQRLSLDTLKIDHSFVNAIENGHQRGNGRAIIGAIVALARSLGLRVVAEGVETPAQRDFLLQIGCQIFQGFLYCAPADAAQIEPLLCKQTCLVPQALAQPA